MVATKTIFVSEKSEGGVDEGELGKQEPDNR